MLLPFPVRVDHQVETLGRGGYSLKGPTMRID